MIFGNDEEDESVFDKTIEFLSKSKIDIPWPGIITPYPGTRLYNRLKNENRILACDYPSDWVKYNSTVVVKLKNYSLNDFIRHFKKFTSKNYSFWRIFVRTLNTLFYSRSILRSIVTYNTNRSLARRFKSIQFIEEKICNDTQKLDKSQQRNQSVLKGLQGNGIDSNISSNSFGGQYPSAE